jgi:acyl CoA:acetate/3-ketoacid CoA transferase
VRRQGHPHRQEGFDRADWPPIRRVLVLRSPLIWQYRQQRIAAYNVPSGIMFDIHREAAAKRPGVLTKIGMDTFVDPVHEGCAMNAKAVAAPIVKKINFEGEEWLYFPAIIPNVAIIRATSSDERGNLTFEHEGAYIGALDSHGCSQ